MSDEPSPVLVAGYLVAVDGAGSETARWRFHKFIGGRLLEEAWQHGSWFIGRSYISHDAALQLALDCQRRADG